MLDALLYIQHCKYISEVDIIHEDIPGTRDGKKVTIMFVPIVPEQWKTNYEEDVTDDMHNDYFIRP